MCYTLSLFPVFLGLTVLSDNVEMIYGEKMGSYHSWVSNLVCLFMLIIYSLLSFRKQGK